MDYLKQREVLAGLLFIAVGIVVGVFKQHWILAGLNTKSSYELAEMDLDYVTKYVGLFFGILGILLVLTPLFFTFFNVSREIREAVLVTVILSFIVFILLYFNVIKRKRIYNKKGRRRI